MFIPVTGIASALSQCTPFAKGKLSSNDFRFKILEQSVDCRTAEERDPKSKNYLHKSRYSPVSHYISNHEFVLDEFNDTPKVHISSKVLNLLNSQGIDKRLAYHIGSLFARSPVPAYEREL